MYRKLAAILLSLVLAFTLFACGNETPAPDASEAAAPAASVDVQKDTPEVDASDLTIAFCINNMSDAFPITILRGVQDACDEYGVNLVYQGPSTSDYTLQTPVLESMLNGSEADGLLIIPCGGDNMLQPVTEAIDKYDIPVITMDVAFTDESVFLAHVTSDNYAGGKLAADALDELIQASGSDSHKVAAISSNPSSDTNVKRLSGWRDEIQKLGYTVVSEQWCNNDPSTAASQTSSILLTFPDTAGFFGGNLFSSQGVINALSSDGVNLPLVCFDAGQGQVEALRNKEVDALIVQKPYLIGYTAATYMIEYLTRGTQPEQYTYLEPCIAYYDDLENPEINQYFYDAVE